MSSLASRKRSRARCAACCRLSADCCCRTARFPACRRAASCLPLLSRPACPRCRSTLAALPLLPLLALLPQLLLHLLLQLLRLALQHFLLPLLFGGLRAVALLLRETLLPLGQFVELLQRIVDFLRLLLGGRRRSFLRSRTDSSRYRAPGRTAPPDRAPRLPRRLRPLRRARTRLESAGTWLPRAADIAEPSARSESRPSTSSPATAARPASWRSTPRSCPSGNR